MKFVIQRVSEASCRVDQNITGAIDAGYCVLIGIEDADTREIADKMLSKMLNLRIFSDENGKTNLSLNDVNGSLHCMQIAVKEIVLLLRMRVNRILRRKCMNISYPNVKKQFRMSRQEYLVRI